MFAISAKTVRPQGTTNANALTRIVSACLDGIATYFFRRSAIARLHELDDRALRDIGLVRSQIEAAVRGLITLQPSQDATMISSAARVHAQADAGTGSTAEAVTWN